MCVCVVCVVCVCRQWYVGWRSGVCVVQQRPEARVRPFGSAQFLKWDCAPLPELSSEVCVCVWWVECVCVVCVCVCVCVVWVCVVCVCVCVESVCV